MRQRNPRKPEVGKTRAWAALVQALEGKTQLELETETGVAQSVISSLVRRARLPGHEVRSKLEKIKIKASWWKEPVSAGRAA